MKLGIIKSERERYNKKFKREIMAQSAKEMAEIIGNKISEKDVIRIGFIQSKQYSHDEFETTRYKKGCLEVQFTYKSKSKQLHLFDVTIDEINALEVTMDEIILLDEILNK